MLQNIPNQHMLVFSTGSVEKLFRNSCSVVNIPPYFLLLSHSCLKDYLTHLVLQVLLWKNRILYFSKVCMTKSLVLLSHIPLMQCVVSLLILMSFVFCLLFLSSLFRKIAIYTLYYNHTKLFPNQLYYWEQQSPMHYLWPAFFSCSEWCKQW